MNEIFSEENFRNTVIVRRGVKSVQAQFDKMDRLAIGSEFVIAYTRDENYRFEQFRIDLDEQRPGSWNNHWRGTDRPTMRYELFGIFPESGQWRWSLKRSKDAIENYKLLLEEIGKNEQNITQEDIDAWYFMKHEDGEDYDLLRLSKSGKPEHYIPPSDTKFGSSLWADLKPNGNSQLKMIFGKKVFDNPKSVDLVKRLLIFANVKDGDIILDSFSGSGTTAHAVLTLNKEDGGNRKFILVECEDYADKITAERVRRVIKGVPKAKDENLRKGLGGTFSYFELGKAIELESILSGDRLPTYKELARYVFYTATGEEFKPKAMNEKKNLVGESSNYKVYLFYEPDIEKLKNIALTLERAKSIGKPGNKRRLVFAPTKYLDQAHLDELRIDFAQLPFEIYELAR